MKEGAWDYLEKPCSTERLQEVLLRALDHRAVVLKSRRIERALLRNDPAAVNFPGISEATETLRTALRRVAATRQHVHLVGAEGTGKRQAAYVINQLAVEPYPFVRVNFAAPDHPQLSKLAFDTPADISVRRLDMAPPGQQSELVAALRGNPDLRMISASIHPLTAMSPSILSDETELAQSVIEVRLPTLRERQTDLPVIFETLLRQAVHSLDIDMPDMPETVLAEIMTRPWPGNIPELRSFAMSFAQGHQVDAGASHLTLAEQMDAFEKLVLIRALQRSGGRVTVTAQHLGIPRNTLYDRMARYDLTAREFRAR